MYMCKNSIVVVHVLVHCALPVIWFTFHTRYFSYIYTYRGVMIIWQKGNWRSNQTNMHNSHCVACNHYTVLNGRVTNIVSQ